MIYLNPPDPLVQSRLTDPSRRIGGLDSLRGIAIIFVLIYHAVSSESSGQLGDWIVWFRSFLWTGVDLFFVLSGFLITRILIRTKTGPRFFSTFYARRSLRVFPLFYGYAATLIFLPRLIALVQSSGEIVTSEEYRRLWDGQEWVWLYLHNFLQARGPSQLPGMGHLWSLAVEEQFYLVWPLLVWFSSKRRLPSILLVLLTVSVAIRMVALFVGYNPWAIMHLTWFRLDGLVMGSLIASIQSQPTWLRLWRSSRNWLFAFAGLAVLAVAVSQKSFEWINPVVQCVGFLAVAVIGGCVVDLVVERASFGPPSPPNMFQRFLTMFGKYSYAIYIFHMLVIHSVRHLGPELNDFVVLVVASFLSLVVGILSWHLFESHWLRLKPDYIERP